MVLAQLLCSSFPFQRFVSQDCAEVAVEVCLAHSSVEWHLDTLASLDFPEGGRELMILLCVPGRQSRCNSDSYAGCPLSPLSCPLIRCPLKMDV